MSVVQMMPCLVLCLTVTASCRMKKRSSLPMICLVRALLIMVNHWGTIILAEPLELPDDGRRYIDEETDWNYDPFGGAEKNQKPCVTVGEFMNQYLNR
ncbi:LPD28 domain-containing protein [Faecalibacterium prausnitzii]|uniref:LPD28 domain-containing protein n=1 Tax=Faecalibacterium prausnitzii TaxID=853 RepID=UPI00325ACD02